MDLHSCDEGGVSESLKCCCALATRIAPQPRPEAFPTLNASQCPRPSPGRGALQLRMTSRPASFVPLSDEWASPGVVYVGSKQSPLSHTHAACYGTWIIDIAIVTSSATPSPVAPFGGTSALCRRPTYLVGPRSTKVPLPHRGSLSLVLKACSQRRASLATQNDLVIMLR